MKLICAWHKPFPIVIRESPGEPEFSHGICPECRKVHFPENLVSALYTRIDGIETLTLKGKEDA